MLCFLIWFETDDTEPSLVGVADTREQANKMIEKCKDKFSDSCEYRIQGWVKNQVTLNDIQYRF